MLIVFYTDTKLYLYNISPFFSDIIIHCKKKKKLGYLKILSQPSKADFLVFSTYFFGNFSTFCCINLKQEVEKTQKSAEAGCLNFKFNFFFFYSVVYHVITHGFIMDFHCLSLFSLVTLYNKVPLVNALININ